jgi:putative membrane protein (TIGR04086 family)
MSGSVGLRWGWIALGALLVEVALFAVVVVLNFVPDGRAILLYSVLPLCVVATFFGGLWVARKAGGRFLWHGLLVGALAALFYGVLTCKATLPTAYVVANYLKLAGGAAGGMLAQRWASPAASPPSAA